MVPNAGFGQVLDPLLDALNSDLVLGLLLLDLLLSALELDLQLGMREQLLGLSHRRPPRLQLGQYASANRLRFAHPDQHALVKGQVVGGDLVAVEGGVIFLHPLKLIAQLVFDTSEKLIVSDLRFASSQASLVDHVPQFDGGHGGGLAAN